MSKYADVDELVAELNRTYKGFMPDLCMSPLGTENWLLQRARRIPDPLPEYRAPQSKVSAWE